jgi:hypothetical protein
MAKNRLGVLVVHAAGFEELLGNVTTVSENGVTIEAREFGKQTRQEYFFPKERIIAHSDEGEGFVTVVKETVAACFLGKVLEGDVGVETDSGRIIMAGSFPGNRTEIIYQDENLSSLFAKEGRRRSGRFDTKSERSSEKPSKKSSKEETPKKKKIGKRR